MGVRLLLNEPRRPAAAKRSGEYPSRPKLLSHQKMKYARKMLGLGEETTNSIAALFDVDRTTIWRALQIA